MIESLSASQLEMHYVTKHLIEKYGEHEGISIEDFTELVDEHPQLYYIFLEVWKCELWAAQEWMGTVLCDQDGTLTRLQGFCKNNVIVLADSNVRRVFCVSGYKISLLQKSPLMGLSFVSRSDEVCLWFEDLEELERWRRALRCEEAFEEVPETKHSIVYNV